MKEPGFTALIALIAATSAAASMPAAAQQPPEAVVVARVRLAAVRKLEGGGGRGLQTFRALAKQVFGVDLLEEQLVARSGIDASRDLRFFSGARGLDRIRRVVRMPYRELLTRFIRYMKELGPDPLPVGWSELWLPTTDTARTRRWVARAVGRLLVKLHASRTPPKAQRIDGLVEGRRSRYQYWRAGDVEIVCWETKNMLRLRMGVGYRSRFAKGIAALPPRGARTVARIKACGFEKPPLGLYVDAARLARYEQALGMITVVSASAGIDPAKKAKFVTRGAKQTRVFEQLQRLSARAFTFLCEAPGEVVFGLTPQASRAVSGAVARSGKLGPPAVARLAAVLGRVSDQQLRRWLRQGGRRAAGKYVGLFLWPALLGQHSPRTAALAHRVQAAYGGKPASYDGRSQTLRLKTTVAARFIAPPQP